MCIQFFYRTYVNDLKLFYRIQNEKLEVAAVEERIDNSGKNLQIFTLAFCTIISNHLYPSSNFSIRGVEAGRRGEDAGGSGKASPQDI
jgi:hypothetical protein